MLTPCIIWLLTLPCSDDLARWDPVTDADLSHYVVMYDGISHETAGLDWPVGCFDGTVRVTAVDLAGNESANPSFLRWELDPGRMMDTTNIKCDMPCQQCRRRWRFGPQRGMCRFYEPIPGKHCCHGRMCDDAEAARL